MPADLSSLRIDKSDRVEHRPRSAWPWIVLIFLLAGGAIAWAFAGRTAVAVRTVRVKVVTSNEPAPDPVALNATGYIMAAHKIELASKAVGRVAWVGVEMGDRIKKGQVLVRLEDDEYRARVAQQQGQLDNAKAKLDELKAGSRPQEVAVVQATLDKSLAELAVAKTNLKRLQDLRSTKAVSVQQIDDAEALVNARQAQVDADRQQLDLSRVGPRREQIAAQEGTVRQLDGGLALSNVDLDNTIIRSPIDGTVLARNVEVGEFVTTGFVGENGAKGYVLSIADLSDLRVELDITQRDFAKVRPKQPCMIVTDAYPDKKYPGVVDLVSPEANRQKGSVQVRVKVLQPDGLLRPDMDATVAFLSPDTAASRPGASQPVAPQPNRPTPVVPASAVRDGNVFVVENGKAVRQSVTTDPPRGDRVTVRRGLIGGEELVVDPPAALADGDRVTAAPDASESK